MFNFSKVLEETDPRNPQSRQRKDRYQKKEEPISTNRIKSNDFETVPNSHDHSRFANIHIEGSLNVSLHEVKPSSLSPIKKKAQFPASFYRIKYQSHQRKKQKWIE